MQDQGDPLPEAQTEQQQTVCKKWESNLTKYEIKGPNGAPPVIWANQNKKYANPAVERATGWFDKRKADALVAYSEENHAKPEDVEWAKVKLMRILVTEDVPSDLQCDFQAAARWEWERELTATQRTGYQVK